MKSKAVLEIIKQAVDEGNGDDYIILRLISFYFLLEVEKILSKGEKADLAAECNEMIPILERVIGHSTFPKTKEEMKEWYV